MSDGKIKYTIDAEDKVSDVLARVKQSYGSLTGAVKSTYGAFRNGGISGAVEHLKGLRINGLASSGMFKLLVSAINPVTLALGLATLTYKAFSAAVRAVSAAIGDAVVFQKHTFDLKALEGSYAAARQTMLALTEGKQAVDAEFGTDAVVKAYKNLHTYSNGALASANMVNLLGNRAKHTGKSIEEMSEIAGKAWQAISQGNGLGMAKEQLMSGMRIDASVIKELEDMQKAGASAGDVWLRLRDELEKTGNTIAASGDSIDAMNKRIADAKGTISTAFGEMFLPLVSNLKYAQAFWMDAFASMIGRSKEVREELAETARLREKEALDRKQAEELSKKWADAKGRETGRREDERLNAMPAWQLGQEAEKAKRENRVEDWEKLTQLREKKLAEEAKARADELAGIQKEADANRQAQAKTEADATKEAERLAKTRQEAAKAAADALAGRKDELALAGMSPEKRAAELERRAAAKAAEAAGIRGGRTDDKLSAVELAAALTANLEALNLSEMAKGERSSIAGQKASEADAEASRKLSIKEAADAARKELAGMGGTSTAGIDIAGRAQWMANIRAGRSPDEQIAENTKRIADLLEVIKKDGGIQ
jgi:hypothetical protein